MAGPTTGLGELAHVKNGIKRQQMLNYQLCSTLFLTPWKKLFAFFLWQKNGIIHLWVAPLQGFRFLSGFAKLLCFSLSLLLTYVLSQWWLCAVPCCFFSWGNVEMPVPSICRWSSARFNLFFESVCPALLPRVGNGMDRPHKQKQNPETVQALLVRGFCSPDEVAPFLKD